jgi:hypothetical protein
MPSVITAEKIMTVNEKARRPKRLKYRLIFIFLFALLSFLFAFTMYMKEDEDLKLPFGIFAAKKEDTDDFLPDETVLITDVKAENAVNPVPEKKAQDKTFGADTLFVGSPKLSGLYEYDITANSAVISDSAINSSNLGNLIVKRDGERKTIKNIVMDEKKSRIFILLDPEAEIDTEALTDFCTDLVSNNKSLKIYFISALPGENSDSFNAKLLDFANETGVYYLDFATGVQGNDGQILNSFGAGDGKLNKVGFEFLQDYIATHYV